MTDKKLRRWVDRLEAAAWEADQKRGEYLDLVFELADALKQEARELNESRRSQRKTDM